jgi:tetratricopeptide (TPR) repeat protein
MSLTYSHGREFLDVVRPMLERGDLNAFLKYLGAFWPGGRLRERLSCGHEHAVYAALGALNFVGTMEDCPAVAALLHDDDGSTADLAEHVMWAIWFRAGGNLDEQLALAVRLISKGDLTAAVNQITDILGLRPDYGEAYHQLSLIFFLRGDYRQAILNCRATLLLNPWHFGAMATLGHCHAAAGHLDQAYTAYQRALQLHPRLQGVRQALHEIRLVHPGSTVNSFTNL